MQREIRQITNPGWCCPGHDKYPNDVYASNRSTKQRALGKAKEHRHARRSNKQNIEVPEMENCENCEGFLYDPEGGVSGITPDPCPVCNGTNNPDYWDNYDKKYNVK